MMVLIIEDEPIKAVAMKNAISEIAPKSQIFECENLSSAKNCYVHHDDIDLIIMDWVIPKTGAREVISGGLIRDMTTGIAFLNFMKEVGLDTPVIICSTAAVKITDDPVFKPVVGSVWAVPYDTLAERIKHVLKNT